MGLEIRSITDGEVAAFRQSMLETFGMDPDADPGGNDRFMALVDRAQAWAVFDGSTIAATAATFQDLAIGIPGGGSLPIAGLTMVTVRPTHRRRGLLRRLIQTHLDDARARGFALSALWASEATIYGRFGYGIAAEHDELTIKETHTVAFAARDFDEVTWIDEARAREVLPDVYARATRDRPGILRRTDVWWRERRFNEGTRWRNGASMRRHVIAQRGAAITGFVAYRQRTDGPLSGRNEILELHGVDAQAEATLWRFMLSIDLFHEVTWEHAPVDDPLPHLIEDSRRVRRERTDNLWLRIDDVVAVMSARRYPSDGVLRFTVDGDGYELVVTDGVGHRTPTARTTDLAIDRSALGSLYLGGFAATRLARANRVRGDARAIAIADRLFASAIAPWCAEVF